MAKNWMAQLQKLNGAVDQENRTNAYASVLRSPSPSLNFTFGKAWGLPLGYSLALWGPKKGGKTLVTNAFSGNLHTNDPEAIVVKFNTEMREDVQMTPEDYRIWNIDPKRYMTYETNLPEEIFDYIEGPINEMIQEGAPIKMVIIDSTNNIRGRRSLNADSVGVQQIGDHALTMKDGLSRILSVQRRNKFGLIATCHIAAEMDPLEQKRGNKFKMSAANALMHYAEYFMLVERDDNADARKDLNGVELVDPSKIGIDGKAERTAHKIKVTMKESSLGVRGRVGEFTYDYSKGIVSVHEEVFQLGTNRGAIERPNNLTYVFGERKWSGKDAMLKAIESEPDLQKAIVQKLMLQDIDSVASGD